MLHFHIRILVVGKSALLAPLHKSGALQTCLSFLSVPFPVLLAKQTLARSGEKCSIFYSCKE